MFINGEPVDYNGERNEEAITEWIQSKNELRVKELKTLEDLEQFEKWNLAVLLIVDESDKDILKKYHTFTLNYEDVPFAFTHSSDVRDKLEVN